jgi:hypothetical protein
VQVARALQPVDHVPEAGAAVLVDHDAQPGIVPRMGEVDALRPVLGDRQIGDGEVEIAGRGRLHEVAKSRHHLVLRRQVEIRRDRLPQLDGHAGEAVAVLHHEGRADIEPDLDRLRLRPLLCEGLGNDKRRGENSEREHRPISHVRPPSPGCLEEREIRPVVRSRKASGTSGTGETPFSRPRGVSEESSRIKYNS